MWHSLGKWISKEHRREEYGYYIDKGVMRFKISLSKANIKKIRDVILKCSPDTTDKYEERILDLTVDVWGSAGPDCRTEPVLAGC